MSESVFRERVNDMLGKLDPKYLPPDLWTFEIYPHTIREVIRKPDGTGEVYCREGYLTMIHCNGIHRITHFFSSQEEADEYGKRVSEKGF